MTTTSEVAHKGLNYHVARRLRGLLAELLVSQKKFCELTGWGRATTYRRLMGETDLNISELEHIENTVGIRWQYLLTGQGEPVVSFPLPWMDLNHQPFGELPAAA